MPEDDDPIEYKMILVGDTGVGKTSLFKKIISNVFNEHNVATIGIDRKTIDLEITIKDEKGQDVKKIVKINLVDTAGQERYKAITKSYYKGSNGVLLLYNICDKKTFGHIKEWLEAVKSMIDNYENKYVIFLMGTKLDLVQQEESMREVTEGEARKFCDENNIVWYGECSSKDFTDEKYKNIFKEFAEELFSVVGYNKFVRETVASLSTHKTKKHKKKCGC